METQITTISPARDPFAARSPEGSCTRCFRGYLTLMIEEDDEEIYVAVPCKHCSGAGRRAS